MSKQLKIIYITTILTICSLYAAQPIQPVFQQEFALNRLQALLFTTLMMMPLGIAPLFYGFLLETFSAKVLVRNAILALGIMELLFAIAGNYISLLSIRALQGLMIPAILTSLMSYISLTANKENVQHAIAVYIAATITGGFLGRLLSGFCTELFGWRVFFFILGLALISASWFLGCLKKDAKLKYVRPSRQQMIALMKEGRFRWLYCSIFCIFFVFSALMNILPFELKKINPEFGETGIGVLYLGYAMGVLVSVNTRRIISFFGNESDAIRAGIIIFFLGTVIFFVENYTVMFLGMFVFCSGLFMAHSLLSGFVNKMTVEGKALANGVYISFYYMGGAIGSFLPGIIFHYYGWHACLSFLLIILLLAMICIQRMKASL